MKSSRPAAFLLFAGIVAVVVSGCVSTTRTVMGDTSKQLELRSMQSRMFDTGDRIRTLRTVMATLQDLGFVIDDADDVLGIISATKLDMYTLRMTVTVRPRGEGRLLVRANAQYSRRAVEQPEPYQQFFTALEKAMFLTAQHVD